MQISANQGLFNASAHINVKTIDDKNTIVTMILFLWNILLIYFTGPHKNNDLYKDY